MISATNKRKHPFGEALVLIAGMTALAGCAGAARNKTAAASGAAPVSTAQAPAPVVEAFLEFVGPPDRWAGPPTMMIHLTAKDPEFAELAVTPAISGPGARMDLRRTQRASSSGPARIGATLARESLAELTMAVQAESELATFSGCLFPVRVKLVRADGSVTERSGCRTLTGWPVALSLTTSRVLTASLRSPATQQTNRAVAKAADTQGAKAPAVKPTNGR
jgi:hypothetical protein